MSLKPESLLEKASLKNTASRRDILRTLSSETLPRTVEELHKKLKGSVNEVTLYRALETFIHAGLVQKVELGHSHAHYELIADRKHHHHAICTSCGLIEDVEVSHSSSLKQEALRKAKNFSQVRHYSLEFFGLCKKCAS